MKNQEGLTFIETVISISIFVVASIIIGSLFVSHTKLFTIQESTSALKISKALFAKNLRQAGEQAKQIASDYNIGGISRASSSSTIIFQIPSIDSEGEIISGTYDYTAFYLDGSDLYSETEAALTSQRKDIKQKISNQASGLQFRYNTALIENASLVNSYLYLGSDTTQDEISVSIYLRNKE